MIKFLLFWRLFPSQKLLLFVCVNLILALLTLFLQVMLKQMWLLSRMRALPFRPCVASPLLLSQKFIQLKSFSSQPFPSLQVFPRALSWGPSSSSSTSSHLSISSGNLVYISTASRMTPSSISPLNLMPPSVSPPSPTASA